MVWQTELEPRSTCDGIWKKTRRKAGSVSAHTNLVLYWISKTLSKTERKVHCEIRTIGCLMEETIKLNKGALIMGIIRMSRLNLIQYLVISL